MKELWETILNYFRDPKTSIFNDWRDALIGFFLLTVMPLGSLLSLIVILPSPTFFNYVFPIMSLSLAGMYDSYGRYKYKQAKNVKLGIRFLMDLAAIITAALFYRNPHHVTLIIAPVILLGAGTLLIHETYIRIKSDIIMSDWNPRNFQKAGGRKFDATSTLPQWRPDK